MKKFGSILKFKLIPLIFALVVGLISVLPQFFLLLRAGSGYQGIVYSDSNDDYSYLARMREITEGHWLVGSPYFFEYKNIFPVHLPWGEYFYALPVMVFHISLTGFLLFSKFLFPAVLFLLIFYLIIKLSEDSDSFSSRLNAIAGAMLVTLGYDFVDFKYALNIFLGRAELFHPLIWTRPVNPITGALMLFLVIILTWRLINYPKYRYAAAIGVLTSLMLAYVFSWGLAVAIVGLLLLFFLGRKNLKVAFCLFLSLALSGLLTLPYWWQMVFLGRSGSLGRNGMYFTHALIGNKFIIVCLVLFSVIMALQYYQLKKVGGQMKLWWFFCLTLLLGSLAAFNQQIITGRTIWPGHFVQYTIPLGLVVFAVVMNNWLKPNFKYLWAICLTAIFIATFFFGLLSALSYDKILPAFLQIQKKSELLNWLAINVAGDCVVLTDNEKMQFIIPAYSQCDDYYSIWTFAGVPKDRILHNYFSYLQIKNIKPATVRDYLSANKFEIIMLYFSNWDQMFGRVDTNWLTEKMEMTAQQYEEFYRRDFYQAIKSYRINYVLTDDQLDEEILNKLHQPQLAGEFDGLYLYFVP